MGDLISIIVPCYNEEESLRLFHTAVKKTEKMMPDCRFEILLINDGSKDKTVEVMRELAAEDPEVSYYSFSRNSTWSLRPLSPRSCRAASRS